MDIEEKKTKNKLVPGILIGMVVGIGASVGCFAYDYVKDTEEPETNTVTKEEYKDTKEYKEVSMVDAFKEYYTSKGFVMVNNVKSWDVEIKEKKEDYVLFESTYTCTNGKGDCIYVSQEEMKDDKYVFTIKANGKYDNYKFNITSIEGTAAVDNKEETSNNSTPTTPTATTPTTTTTTTEKEIDFDDLSQQLLNNLTNMGFIFKPNLSMFRPVTFDYLGYYSSKPEEKWYVAHGYYTCLDETSDCVYQEQVGDEDNGAYTFSYGVIVTDGKIVLVTGVPVVTPDLIK